MKKQGVWFCDDVDSQGCCYCSSKEPRIPRMPQLHDFQFFNNQRLSELYEKEVRYLMQANQRNQSKDTIDVEESEDLGEPLTAEEQEEKEQLPEEGFSTWSRRDFNTFIRACEKYGRSDIKTIASEMSLQSHSVIYEFLSLQSNLVTMSF